MPRLEEQFGLPDPDYGPGYQSKYKPGPEEKPSQETLDRLTYGGYCHSCALSGETPQTFEEFQIYRQQQKQLSTGNQHGQESRQET